jgi:PAS domain S-box-containing protein
MKADRKTKSHSRAKATKPEQQRVKNSLQESERRFHEMFEKIQLIAVSLDLEGRVTFCNEFLLQLTGYSSDEVLGCDWFTQFVPDIRSDVKETFLQSLVLGEIVAHYENPIRTKSSADRFIRFSNTILRDEEAQACGRETARERGMV